MKGEEQVGRAELPLAGLGWLPDYPDFRDYTPEHQDVQPLLERTKIAAKGKRLTAPSLPASVDLREWCPPIEDQGELGSCTANAGVGIVEYFERRASGKHIDASRLFLYKTTRNLLQWKGDTGAFLRTTMKALRLFGTPPEEYWPYMVADYDCEPTAFCYAFGEEYKAIKYYRLDPAGTAASALLARVRTHLSAGLPSMFGFTVYQSMSQAASTGKIPVPAAGDKVAGGHAVVAVGYDDNIKTKNAAAGSKTFTGALLIRNSWGLWGPMNGYLWLPYEYVLRGLAADWWVLLKSGWVELGQFE